MALDRNKQYDVLNYCPSPVSISTRDYNELIPGGTSEDPARLPMKLDDIMFVNTKTRIFKDGILYFDPEFEADIYEELRIKEWADILRDEDIEDMLMNPTTENLERLIGITNVMLFERVYGVYIGLKNAGVGLTLTVQNVMEKRRDEFTNRKYKTEIKLRNAEPASNAGVDAMKAQMEAQAAELEALKAMVAKLTSGDTTVATADAASSVDSEKPKPKARSGTKKTATKAEITEA